MKLNYFIVLFVLQIVSVACGADITSWEQIECSFLKEASCMYLKGNVNVVAGGNEVALSRSFNRWEVLKLDSLSGANMSNKINGIAGNSDLVICVGQRYKERAILGILKNGEFQLMDFPDTNVAILHDILWVDDTFYVVGLGKKKEKYKPIAPLKIFRSTDGSDWEECDIPELYSWSHSTIKKMEDKLLVFNQKCDSVIICQNGVWNLYQGSTNSLSLSEIEEFNGRLLAYSSSKNSIMESYNGVEWDSIASMESFVERDGCILLVDNGYCYALGEKILKSSNGKTWELLGANSEWKLIKCAAFKDGQLFFSYINSAETISVTSVFARYLGGHKQELLGTNIQGVQFVAIAWSGTNFIASDRNGYLYISEDGKQWLRRKPGSYSQRTFYDILTVDSLAIAVGGGFNVGSGKQDGVIEMYSSIYFSQDNGYTWEESVECDGAILRDITWNGSVFVACGYTVLDGPGYYASDIYYSLDGRQWNKVSDFYKNIKPESIIWSGNHFFVSGTGQYNEEDEVVIMKSSDGVNWGLEFQDNEDSSSSSYSVTLTINNDQLYMQRGQIYKPFNMRLSSDNTWMEDIENKVLENNRILDFCNVRGISFYIGHHNCYIKRPQLEINEHENDLGLTRIASSDSLLVSISYDKMFKMPIRSLTPVSIPQNVEEGAMFKTFIHKNSLEVITQSEITSVCVFNINGRLLKALSPTGKRGKYKFDRSYLVPGVYVVRVGTENRSFSQKLLLR